MNSTVQFCFILVGMMLVLNYVKIRNLEKQIDLHNDYFRSIVQALDTVKNILKRNNNQK